MITLPDPPLATAEGLVLRPWRLDDAPALVAAWGDAEVQRWTGVPEVRDLAAAARWIAGDEARRRQWLSLDLVVDRGGRVAGEVGLSALDREAGTCEVGWWTSPVHRRLGIATAAATLLVGWTRAVLGLRAVARCDLGNPGSVRVAERAGATVLL